MKCGEGVKKSSEPGDIQINTVTIHATQEVKMQAKGHTQGNAHRPQVVFMYLALSIATLSYLLSLSARPVTMSVNFDTIHQRC